MRDPGFEANVKRWYDDHLTSRYTYQDQVGKKHVIPLMQEHESIQNDYLEGLVERARAEKISSLRKGRKIQIKDRLLQ